ncbi:LuxR C-terminal-related transcriptional regulator [Kineosporia sp. NBRC 101731]|uniref:LuxR C-terminal-related transcriptional regulator n=1 Tax=Kineosporia sp. NBRC 101731 TaxID=3032199 RepID=UPI0024A05E19|nr:LuxR C-terminal-related transcriptional regulator [Kineosporia sp. NBRC 101731]GLY33200.1 helix-turn-helix transcriptional regulator [Kineosporia sp. NBRC 101731]
MSRAQAAPHPAGIAAVPRVSQVRIVLVAADPLSQAGVEGMLATHPRLRLVPVSRAGDAHLLVLVASRPDPQIADVVRAVTRARPLPVLAVLDEPGEQAQARLSALGVVACLWRADVSAQRLVAEIADVHALLSHPASQPLLAARPARDLDEYRRRHAPDTADSAPHGREADVLRLLAEGLAIPEIARRLRYSERTVQKTLFAVTSRLRLRNRTQAMAYAWRKGLL